MTEGECKARLGLGSLRQEFLITNLLELHKLPVGHEAVNHMKTAAGVAVTLSWPSRAPSSSRSFCLKPAPQPFYEHAVEYNILKDMFLFFFLLPVSGKTINKVSVRCFQSFGFQVLQQTYV